MREKQGLVFSDRKTIHRIPTTQNGVKGYICFFDGKVGRWFEPMERGSQSEQQVAGTSLGVAEIFDKQYE